MNPNVGVGPVLDEAYYKRQVQELAKLWAEKIREVPDKVAESVLEKMGDSLSFIIQLRQPGGQTMMWEFLSEGRLDCANVILTLGNKRMLLSKTDAGRSLLMVSTSMRMLPERGEGALCVWV